MVGIVTVNVAVAGQAEVVVVVVPKLKSVGGIVSVKLALDISKKILPIASTRTRAVVLVNAGITTASLPSLAVVANKVVG